MVEKVSKRRVGRVTEASASGTFRTLCVRTCDGYYFPISFSTTRDHFANDQLACEAMCPGADVGLYYHDAKLSFAPDVDEDAALAMVSVNDEPYAKLPAAFSYQRRLDRSCTCGRPGERSFAAAISMAQIGAPLVSSAPQSEFAPIPVPRPDLSEDPETLANREGNFVPRMLDEEAPVSLAGSASERPVRVVWPAYGVDPEKSVALLRPVSQ